MIFYVCIALQRLPLVPMHGRNTAHLTSHRETARKPTRRIDGDSKILMAKENLVSTPVIVMTDMEKQNSWVPVGLRDLPRSPEVFSLMHTNPSLSLRLPRCGATAGRILEHAAKVFYDINERSSPMTFKFGITHCPHFRWSNAKFGYKYCVDKFESMVILYAAQDSSGPSFLEASLIREFGSGMAKKTRDNMFCLFASPWAKKRNTYIAVQVLPYKLLCLGCFMFFKLVYIQNETQQLHSWVIVFCV